jgi:hypothetical protein
MYAAAAGEADALRDANKRMRKALGMIETLRNKTYISSSHNEQDVAQGATQLELIFREMEALNDLNIQPLNPMVAN